MSGIALLAPTQDVYARACALYQKKRGHIQSIVLTSSETVVADARREIEAGATILIARGQQAGTLRRQLNVPILEIAITPQEMGLHIARARSLVHAEKPKIGIFVSEEMLCSLTHFEELFHVELRCFPLQDMTDVFRRIDSAIEEGIDVLIGGQRCMEYAQEVHFPAIPFTATDEGIMEAVRNAENLYQMLERERLNNAQFSLVLDNASNGIAKTDAQGVVMMTNTALCQMLDRRPDQIVGHPAQEGIVSLSKELLQRVLSGAEQTVSFVTKLKQDTVVFTMEGIELDGTVSGAIISCNPIRRVEDRARNIAHKRYMQGFTARCTLEELVAECPDLAPVAEQAKVYAQSRHPIWIQHSGGWEEARRFCQGIHNYSDVKDGPYLELDLRGMGEREQICNLFGAQGGEPSVRSQAGALAKANFGTLVLLGIDRLTPYVQNLLMNTLHQYNTGPQEILQLLQVRILGCTEKRLAALRREQSLRDDLLYEFCALKLMIPPLNSRRRDLALLLEAKLKQYNTAYARYHMLTPEARELLLRYPWRGGKAQIDAFLDRLILSVARRSISAEFTAALLQELYQEFPGEVRKGAPQDCAEAEQLKNTLLLYNCSRSQTAKALGISTTTLWRRMKKYGFVRDGAIVLE